MVFNEILIPQDSFTKTNVTRKRVRRQKSVIVSKNISFILCKHIILLEGIWVLISNFH